MLGAFLAALVAGEQAWRLDDRAGGLAAARRRAHRSGRGLGLVAHLDAAHRQCVGVLGVDPVDQVLPHEAAQVEQGRRVLRGHQHAYPHVAAHGIRHLEHHGTFVPEVGLRDYAVELFTHRGGVDPPVEVELDRAEQLAVVPGPVLERGGGEVGRRQHHAPVVPDVHDDVGEGDLLNLAPLPLDDHDVIHPQRVVERELHAGEDVRQGGLGRQARHDAEQAGGGEQARTHGRGAGDAEQHGADGADDEDHDADAPEHPQLGAHPAGHPVVAHVDAVPVRGHLLGVVEQRAEQPGGAADEQGAEDEAHQGVPVLGHVEVAGDGEPERTDQDGHAERHPDQLHEHPRPGLALADHAEDEGGDRGDGESQDDGRCGGNREGGQRQPENIDHKWPFRVRSVEVCNGGVTWTSHHDRCTWEGPHSEERRCRSRSERMLHRRRRVADR
nr:hypothetical protein BJQ95_01092 [Cryobacterium sp. SO1]